MAVIEANQRFLIARALVQLLLLLAAGFGLSRLDGALWWLCLVFFVLLLLAATLGAFQLKVHFTLELAPPWRALALKPVPRSKEHVLELHLQNGGVTMVAVRGDMVDGVLKAARDAGLEVVTEPDALAALDASSQRLERLHDIEALIPHVPTPELRAELSAAVARVREQQPPGADPLLKELEVLLMAEKNAHATTSLRGPKPVFEKELKEKAAKLAAL